MQLTLKGVDMKSTCWLQIRNDMRYTKWHIMDQEHKDIYYRTLCDFPMPLHDTDVKWDNDDDYKWQFGHYFVPDKVCNKCQKIANKIKVSA